MVPIYSLWLPILLSAVFVFIASSIIHMVIGYHKGDYNKLDKEADVMDALRPFNLAPGDYSVPRAESMKDMSSSSFTEKLNKGPVFMMTVFKNGPRSMGASLGAWFVFSLVVGVFAAYVAGRALTPGAHYLAAFRFAGVAAFLAHGLSTVPSSIWYGRSWGTTARNVLDGLIYALLTGGTFGWLWPGN
jgi:hypothetical protein